MALKQGFVTIGTDPYVYQENTTNNTVSASIGIDSAGTGLFNINVSTSAGAKPGVGFQPISIDPVTGVILFTPLGGGYVRVDGPLDITGGVTLAGDIATNNSAASAAAYSFISEKDRAGGIITTGDALGQIYFKGHDGVAYVTGASITATSSGTIAANRVASNLVFSTHPDSASGLTPTTRMTIASTGAITIASPDSGVGLTVSGGGAAITGATSTTTTLTAGTDITATNGDVLIGNTDVGVTAPFVYFKKSRTGAIITSGDDLGEIAFQGYDGASYFTSARIRADSSGTVGAGRIASTMQFYTAPDSVTASTLRMSIAPTGEVTIAAPDSGTALTITNGGLTVTAGSTTLSALNSRGIVRTDASGVLATSAGTDGQILISDTATGTPTWATITAGAGISVTNGANAITIAATDSTSWIESVASPVAMAVDKGYIVNNGALITLTLPAVAVVGDTVRVSGKGAGGWLIAQNAGQTIYFGTSTTTTGVGGSLASTAARDSIELVCVTANNDWNVLSVIGTITVV